MAYGESASNYVSRQEQGFSLIEMLVVMLIIGVLAAIAIPAYLSQRAAGQRATLQADLRNIAVEAEGFFHTNDSYDGFEASAAFTGFRASTGVIMTLAPANSNTTSYCIAAALGVQTWSARTDPVTGQPAIGAGAC